MFLCKVLENWFSQAPPLSSLRTESPAEKNIEDTLVIFK